MAGGGASEEAARAGRAGEAGAGAAEGDALPAVAHGGGARVRQGAGVVHRVASLGLQQGGGEASVTTSLERVPAATALALAGAHDLSGLAGGSARSINACDRPRLAEEGSAVPIVPPGRHMLPDVPSMVDLPEMQGSSKASTGADGDEVAGDRAAGGGAGAGDVSQGDVDAEGGDAAGAEHAATATAALPEVNMPQELCQTVFTSLRTYYKNGQQLVRA